MNNSKEFALPDGDRAFASVLVDPGTGLPLVSSLFPQVFVLGKCSDLDNVIRDTWDGPTALYVFPAAPIQMQVVSTAAGDAAAGAGARTVEINYLDTDYAEQTEFVTLNGVTPVQTVAVNILRVNQFHVRTAGANGITSGTISLQAVGGATTYSLIPAGRTNARQAIYTVPAGYALEIQQWQVSSGSSGSHFCQHTLAATSHEGELLPGVFLPKDEQGTQNGGLVINYPFVSEHFPERTDLKVLAVSDNAAANVIALTAFFGRLHPM